MPPTDTLTGSDTSTTFRCSPSISYFIPLKIVCAVPNLILLVPRSNTPRPKRDKISSSDLSLTSSGPKFLDLRVKRAKPESNKRMSATLSPTSTRADVEKAPVVNFAQQLPISDLDNGIVGWEGPDDPLNPQYVDI